MRWGLREVLAPLQHGWAALALRARETAAVARGLGGLARENREQAEELIRLRQQVAALATVAEENRALRSQLGFQREQAPQLIAAEVIARDAVGWWEALRIGRGLLDNVRPDQAVVTAEGLVGRTQAVSPRTAEVLLLSDPRCRVGVQVARTGGYGILMGRGSSPTGRAVCRVDFINRNLAPRLGDAVVTSGLGQVFPPGILIGYIERVYQDASGLYLAAEVTPKADLSRLRYVFVLTTDEFDPAVHLERVGARSARIEGGP